MNEQEINKIMKETCFGLAYCCGLKKECPYRDNTIKKLGLTKRDYVKLKEKFNKELVLLIKSKEA